MTERKYRAAQKKKSRQQNRQETASTKNLPKKKHLFWRIGKVLLLIVLLLCFCAGIWIYYKLSLLQYVTPEEITDKMKVPHAPSLAEYEILSQNSAIQIAPGEIYKDPMVVNILLLGTDEREEAFSTQARSDSMMILSVNKRKNTWTLLSLERAMGVLVPNRPDDWLTHTFRYGGPELVLATVRSHFKLDIDYYIRINFSAFEKAIDAIDGVDIGLTYEEATYLNEWCGGSFTEGAQHLNGKYALDYARMRKIDSDWKRVQRQRNVLSAILEKVQKNGLFSLNYLLDEVLPLVQTNLGKGKIIGLSIHLPFLMQTELVQLTLPAEGTYTSRTTSEGRSVYHVDFAANSALLKELLYGVHNL